MGQVLIFRDPKTEQRYLLEKQKTAIKPTVFAKKAAQNRGGFSASKLSENQQLIEDLWSEALERGRMPTSDEFEQADSARALFGSVHKAFDACFQVFDRSELQKAELTRRNDLLVYLALEFFCKRRPYRRMPSTLRRDISYHFGKYSDARGLAEAALYSVSDTALLETCCEEANSTLSAVVYRAGESLTMHKSLLNACPPLLRIYVGCALQMYGDLVSIDDKVHTQTGKVTLQGYDDFEAA